MIKQLIPVFLLLRWIKCSQVVDHHSQRVLKISDFCPDTPLCPEGAHVMCSYQSNQRFGPRCANPQPKATMNEKLSQLYIDIVNMVRSEAANGKAIGKDKLPRAYGLMRLKWDEELATFAQTLADQCVLRHDLCRGSLKFPNPGQTIGYIHLTLSDWQPIRNKKKVLPKELTDETLEYAIHNILKTAYDTKANIIPTDVYKVPDFIKNQAAKRMYFQLVSRSTHVGCGLSAFSDISVKMQNKERPGPLKYGRETLNVILLVCNYGEDVREGTSIYDTSPRSGATPRCGCPVGTWEDENCLCNEMIATTTSTTVATTTLKCPQGKAQPTVVLLPIVTVEDAPPDKLFENFNGGVGHSGEMTGIGRGSNLDMFNEQVYPFIQGAKHPGSHDNPEILAVESHEENHLNKDSYKPFIEQSQQYNRARPENRVHNDYAKKSSIFARVPQFRLPAKNTNDNQYVVKKDVAPRKDFSNIQNVVTDYFKKKNAKDFLKKPVPNKVEELLNNVIVKNISEPTTEVVVYHPEDKLTNELHLISQHNDNPSNNPNVDHSHSDHKLMAILDTLEREVKHVELDVNKKEIFDAKLRKIYGTVVGKPVDLLIDPRREDRANNNIEDFKKIDQYYDTNFVSDHKRLPTDNEYESLIRNYTNTEIINERQEKQLNGRSWENDDYVDENKFAKAWKYPDVEQKFELRRQKTEGEQTDKFKYRDCDKLHEPENKLRSIKTSRYLSPINKNDRNNREEKRNKAAFIKDMPDGVLTKDRRKFYQDKLDAIEKKLQSSRRQNKNNDHFNGKRQNRRVLSDIQNRRSKRRYDEFYLPDRAKWIGF